MNRTACIILLSLTLTACLEMPNQIPATPTPTQTAPSPQEQASGAVYHIPTASPRTCARVTASVLHMRDAPNGTVIHWLYEGQTVPVSDASGDWWQVEAYNLTGWSHSRYLERTLCK